MQKESRQSSTTGVVSAANPAPTFDEAIADVLGADAADQWNVQGPLFRHRIEAKDRTDVLRRVFLDSDPQWLICSAYMVAPTTIFSSFGRTNNISLPRPFDIRLDLYQLNRYIGRRGGDGALRG